MSFSSLLKMLQQKIKRLVKDWRKTVIHSLHTNKLLMN